MEENNKKFVDFNCDLAQTANLEEEDKSLKLIDFVSSVNVSCGFHAGCPLTIKKAIEQCKFKNKVIGAHIGLPKDTANPIELSEEDIEAIVLYQLGAISSFAKAYSLNIEHVRPHGEMYRLAQENVEFSIKIAKAIKKFNKWLVYYGAMGETLKNAAEEAGINYASEFIAENGESIEKLKELISVGNVPDTIHFSSDTIDAQKLIEETKQIVTPRPVNFNNAAVSGWVE